MKQEDEQRKDKEVTLKLPSLPSKLKKVQRLLQEEDLFALGWAELKGR
jgi:HD-like signal output (HDOD) protein